jgi:hypothetical protein
MRPLNPACVSPLLLHAITQVTEKAGASQAKVVQAIEELSRLFTKERTALKRPYMDDPALACAYLQYFLPVNLAKIQVLLDEMPAVAANEGFSVLQESGN